MSAEHPHGPPFTVERYGTFGQSVIAERDWLLEEVERLRSALRGVRSCASCSICQAVARTALDVPDKSTVSIHGTTP